MAHFNDLGLGFDFAATGSDILDVASHSRFAQFLDDSLTLPSDFN